MAPENSTFRMFRRPINSYIKSVGSERIGSYIAKLVLIIELIRQTNWYIKANEISRLSPYSDRSENTEMESLLKKPEGDSTIISTNVRRSSFISDRAKKCF